jgi:hypothetical protein
MPEHTKISVITKVQNISFAEVQDQTMLIKFFDKQSVIHKEFVPEGQVVNSAFYVELIGRC